jgi:tetratricopeptide (TPR) repeat protein
LLPTVILLLGTLGACGPEAPAPGETAAGGEDPSGREETGILDVPRPDLSLLEEVARNAIEEERERLDAVLADPAASDESRGAAYADAGMLYHAYGIHDAAEACYRNAHLLAPDDYRWPYCLGHVYRSQGKPDEAVEFLTAAVELEPEFLPALIHLAKIEIDENRLDRAEPLLERAREIDPMSAPVLIGLGKVASGRRDYTAAVGYFEEALRLAPDATEIHYPLGLAYRGLGDQELAERHMLRRGTKRAPMVDPMMATLETLAKGWRIHQNRGTNYFQKGSYDLALEEFRRAVELAPDEPVARNNLGSALTALGDFEGAEREYRAALDIDLADSMAHFNLGTLRARADRDDDAIEHYRAALESNPDYLKARFNLANALCRAGEFENAAAQYARVVERDERNGSARLGEALALIRVRRYGEALERLEAGVQALPEDRPLRHALVRVLSAAPVDEVRDGQRALAICQGLVNEERSLQHVAAFAMAAAETGQMDVAVQWQEAAIAAVKRTDRSDLLPALEENLGRYRAGKPCRMPWRDKDPVFYPVTVAPDSGQIASRGS